MHPIFAAAPVLLIAALAVFMLGRRRARTWTHVTAVVVARCEVRGVALTLGRSARYEAPSYAEYTDHHGVVHPIELKPRSEERHLMGREFTVAYRPDNPAEATRVVAGIFYIVAGLLVMCGILAVVFGLIP